MLESNVNKLFAVMEVAILRKHQQRHILEMVKTLGEAHDEIKRLFSRCQLPAVMQLLGDCQALALQIGNYIEQLEGEGTQTVSRLEEYCELAYQISTELGEKNNAASYVKKLQAQALKIESCIKTELRPDRLEVLFLPYNASMWDSLESIWLAATADPQCAAFVVALPYYELRPDGVQGELHYEGTQYPANVPVMDWRSYDVEERHPDIIFTHYPYDDMSNNASVHPEFYSKRLREHCEQLVFVPYFVAIGPTFKEEYGCLPGIVYAHHVMVQSEELRQSLIGHYSKFDKEYGWNGKFGCAEDKILAMGSPKFDKLLNAKREDYTLPDEWRSLIFKADGTRKKIVLYNTHMFIWIARGEQYFEKLRSVFQIFNDRDDVILWWRPHPNTELNFRTKRPDLLPQYKALIMNFKRSRRGIYDDTPDLHRAIVWSDAYYGDRSSLVALCQMAGKPIMIQNMNITTNEINCIPRGLLCPINDDIYFTALHINAIFKMNARSWEPTYVGSFPREVSYWPASSYIHYYDWATDGSLIYCAPYSADEIAIYNISDGSISKIAFPIPENHNSKHFISVKQYAHSLYFIPCTYGAVLKMDMENNKISLHSDFIEKLSMLFTTTKPFEFFYPAYAENSAWFTVKNTNAIVQFSMETLVSTVHQVGEETFHYGGICYDGHNFWLSSRIGPMLTKWNPKTGLAKAFSGFTREEDAPISFQRVVYCGGFVWLFPIRSNTVYKINIHTDEIIVADEFSMDISTAPNRKFKYFSPRVIDNNIYVSNKKDATFIKYTPTSRELRKEKLALSGSTLKTLRPLLSNSYRFGQYKNKQGYWSENGVNILYIYLEYIADGIGVNDNHREPAQTNDYPIAAFAGANIYNYVKQIIL